jgi:sulfotransferase
LRQNPAFSASITSPVAMLCSAVQQRMSGNSKFTHLFDDTRRANVLRGMVSSYYANEGRERIICDTMRDIGWIIDSVERMLIKNPLQLSRIFNYAPGASVYARAETLMNSDAGLVGRFPPQWSSRAKQGYKLE